MLPCGQTPFAPQLFDQFLLEIGRNGVLELFGFIVDLVPLQPEHLGQHPLDQVVPVEQPAGDFASRRRERNLPLAADLDQSVALEPLDRHGYCRRGTCSQRVSVTALTTSPSDSASEMVLR